MFAVRSCYLRHSSSIIWDSTCICVTIAKYLVQNSISHIQTAIISCGIQVELWIKLDERRFIAWSIASPIKRIDEHLVGVKKTTKYPFVPSRQWFFIIHIWVRERKTMTNDSANWNCSIYRKHASGTTVFFLYYCEKKFSVLLKTLKCVMKLRHCSSVML